MTTPTRQKREPTLPGDFVPMSRLLSASYQTLRSTPPANVLAGGWCIVSWAVRVLAAALPRCAFRRVYSLERSRMPTPNFENALKLSVSSWSWSLKSKSWRRNSLTVKSSLSILNKSERNCWTVICISLFIFSFPLLVGYKMNCSIQNQDVKHLVSQFPKLVRAIL